MALKQPGSQFVDVPKDNNKVISDLFQNITFSENVFFNEAV